MRFGVHRWTWANDFNAMNIDTILRQAKATGADSVEMRIPDAALFNNQYECKRIRQMTDELDLELCCNTGTPAVLDMCSDDRYIREAAIDYIRQVIEAAGRVGVRKLSGIIHSNWPARYDNDRITVQVKRERLNRSIEGMRKVMPLAELCGVMINLEVVNRFEHYLLNTADEGVAFCQAVESPNCRLLLDVFHMNAEEDNIPEAIRRAQGYVGHFHVSEPNRKIPFHTERICWPEIGRALRETGYDETVIIEAAVKFDEMDSYRLRIWRDLQEDVSLDGRLKALQKGLDYIREQFGQKRK